MLIPTHSFVCIDTGELDGAVVAPLGILLVLLQHALWCVPVGQAIVHQEHLKMDGWMDG